MSKNPSGPKFGLPYRTVPSETFPDRLNIVGPTEVGGAMAPALAHDRCRQLNDAYSAGVLSEATKAYSKIKDGIKVKRGIYITLVPHGYEVDFLRHNDVLDMYMRDESFIMEGMARSFGEDVDVAKATDIIIDALSNIEKTINEQAG